MDESLFSLNRKLRRNFLARSAAYSNLYYCRLIRQQPLYVFFFSMSDRS